MNVWTFPISLSLSFPLFPSLNIDVGFIIWSINIHSFLFSGLYTLEDQLHDHEIVIPRKVSHKGELISLNVSHHHDEDGTEVHYRLSIAGKEYHIELTAVKDFIGPSMIVERHKRDFHVRAPPKYHSSRCHYRGVIRDHPNSRVALSACDGLVSFLPFFFIFFFFLFSVVSLFSFLLVLFYFFFFSWFLSSNIGNSS